MTAPNRAKTTLPAPPPLTERIRGLREALLNGLVERDVAVRLALLGALAGEHLLLLGPPGTGKSLVARRLRIAIQAEGYFERLLTRFSVPEELFGPLSIKGLEEDRYERQTKGYLPQASVAFLDEVFKANSAILNALLTLLNEREFDNGTTRTKTPLVTVVGASNELPEGEELDALFDRFLLRLHVGPVSREQFTNLLRLRGEAVPSLGALQPLTAEELREVQQAAQAIEVPEDVESLLFELRDWCTANELQVSDRRWRKIVRLLQVSAYVHGRKAVSIWDCWIVQHCVSTSPEERERVYAWYAARVGASKAMDPSRLTKIVVAWEGLLKRDQESRSQARDKEGHLLFKGVDGKLVRVNSQKTQARRDKSEPLFLAPAQSWTHYYCDSNHRVSERTNQGKGYARAELDSLWIGHHERFSNWDQREAYLANTSNWLLVDVELSPSMEPTRFKKAVIQDYLGQVDQIKLDVVRYRKQLTEHIATLKTEVLGHLWVTSDFVQPATDSLNGTLREVDTLIDRLGRLRKGIELLPLDDVVAVAGKAGAGRA